MLTNDIIYAIQDNTTVR